MKLYKKSATGSMQVWEITGRISEATLYIKYGALNGALQTQPHKVTVNNSGRSIVEQMKLELSSRVVKQKAKGYRETIDEANKFVNKNELDLHKPMLAQRHDKVKAAGMEKFFRQRKYDGHRCLMTCIDGKIVAYSRNGKLIDTLDHITSRMTIPEGVTIDGEIYHHGVPLQTVSSWCKRKQPDTAKLIYHVYDLISDQTYKVRLNRLCEMEDQLGPNVVIAKTWTSEVSIQDDLKVALDEGYEGLILRNPTAPYDTGKRSKHLIKVKHILDDEFKVVDITPSSDGWGVLHCITASGKPFKVSAPGTMHEKHLILQNKQDYIGKMIRVEYFSETKEGKPFHPVATYWRDKDAE